MVFVEPPSAISTARAFLNASLVRILSGVISFASKSITAMPASFARRILSEYGAGIVPLPGSPMPMASVRQFIVFAVNKPAHEPQVGQARLSNSLSSSSVIVPAPTEPTASKTLIRSISLPLYFPASIGPPLTATVGMFIRAAAISMPGVTLSQLGIRTSASKRWASTISSTESAMISRLGSEYFIPAWFIAMPSQTPIVENSNGVPPASRIPALTASAILSR